ncbi:hypothetical protein [Rathayibacter sp. VKM Ac-2805]|uniref:hypothetical protein n=1 Tax=Rathayibacter sp. VKM Ac-2805 TaxID=2609258 RepID=UPI00131F98F2|nr:hypothetical protein [Rathayibacter sp. VKM Ac-2805]QHC72687.1 hypothetical protein GSU40_02545 [Rathayibacter sp. VKM Ac-2805]
MSSDEERRNDARQIRVFTIAACIFLAAAIAFVVLELTTDLNGASGAITCLTLFVVNVGIVLVRRRQRRRDGA